MLQKWHQQSAGDWQALQSAMRTGDAANATAQFRNNLARAALRGETAERMAEVVLLYRIISTIQAVEGGAVPVVGSRLGLGSKDYSYTSHLNKEFDTVALVVMGFIIDNEYPKYQDLGALFGDLLDLRGERKEVNAASAIAAEVASSQSGRLAGIAISYAKEAAAKCSRVFP